MKRETPLQPSAVSIEPEPSLPAPQPAVTREPVVWWLTLALILFGLFFRLERHPPGMYHDEVSIGLNAVSVWNTGADEWGVRLPIYFQGVGDFKSAMCLYSMIPSVVLFGPTTFALLLPNIVCFLLTAVVLGWCVYVTSGNRILARWSALALLTTPSAFLMSRSGILEPWLLTLWHMLGIAAVLRYTLEPSKQRACVAGAVLGLAAYSYAIGRLLVPLEILGLTAILVRDRRTRAHCYPLPLTALVVAVPMAVFMVTNREALFVRLNMMSIFHSSDNLADVVGLFFRNYFSHYSLDFMLRAGQPAHMHSHNMDVGFLCLWSWLPLCAGLLLLWGLRSQPFWAFILWVNVVAFVPASFTTDDVPHPTRALFAIPVFILVISLCFNYGFPAAREMRWVLLATLAFAFYYECALNTKRYFVDYPVAFEQDNGPGRSGGVSRVLEWLQRARIENRGPLQIHFPSGYFEKDGLFVKFFLRLDPRWRNMDEFRASDIYFYDPNDTISEVEGQSLWVVGGGRAPSFPATCVFSLDSLDRSQVFWLVFQAQSTLHTKQPVPILGPNPQPPKNEPGVPLEK